MLFDCGAELFSLHEFHPIGLASSNVSHMSQLGTPEGIHMIPLDTLQIDELDYVFITNFYNMYSLPYLTECYGFKGQIIATEPSIQIGRQLLLEMCHQFSHSSLSTTATHSILHPQQREHKPQLQCYRKIYSEADVLACCEKITTCSFDEQIDLVDGLQASPHSSGYCLGSCNWVIKTQYEKFVFAAQSVTSSTTWRFHSQPMKSDIFSNADCVVMSHLALPSVVDLDAHLGDLCSHVGQTLAAGGVVLLPVSSAGMILDLFAILDMYMMTTGLNPGVHGQSSFGGGLPSTPTIPMFYISSISESVLAYANISAEWLDKTRQERVYTPNNPFTHSDLLEVQKLIRLDSLESFGTVFRSPSIIFTSHPSLRFGHIVPLIEMLKNHPQNSIIFTDPGYDPKEAMAPYLPCALNLHICPLDSRLPLRSVCDLMRRYQPRILVVPKQVQKAVEIGLENSKRIDVFGISQGDQLKINMKRQFERGHISAELAAQLEPKSINGATLISVRASLQHRDGEYLLQPLSHKLEPENKMQADPPQVQPNQLRSTKRLYGRPMPQNVLAVLEEMSIDKVDVEIIDEQRVILILPQLEAKLEFEGAKTKIICANGDARRLLKQVVMRQLKVLGDQAIQQ